MADNLWHMAPCDALFSEIDRLPEGRQKRFLKTAAEECFRYNQQKEESFTISDYIRLQYPSFSSPKEEKADDFEEEPE